MTDGQDTKYYYYENSGQSMIRIPISVARTLSWNHKDDINITIKTIDGKIGLFLSKKEK